MTDTIGAGASMRNTTGRRRGAGIAAGLVALALIAGACGGGDEVFSEPMQGQNAGDPSPIDRRFKRGSVGGVREFCLERYPIQQAHQRRGFVDLGGCPLFWVQYHNTSNGFFCATGLGGDDYGIFFKFGPEKP